MIGTSNAVSNSRNEILAAKTEIYNKYSQKSYSGISKLGISSYLILDIFNALPINSDFLITSINISSDFYVANLNLPTLNPFEFFMHKGGGYSYAEIIELNSAGTLSVRYRAPCSNSGVLGAWDIDLTSKNISQATDIITEKKYALDAVQANPAIEGTLAYNIAHVGDTLTGVMKVVSWNASTATMVVEVL